MFVVWEPILATDWSKPNTSALSRISDARAVQFWDEERVLADRLARDAREPQPRPDCCEQDGVLWDLAAVYPKGARWEERLPVASVFDGPVVRVTGQISGALGAP